MINIRKTHYNYTSACRQNNLEDLTSVVNSFLNEITEIGFTFKSFSRNSHWNVL